MSTPSIVTRPAVRVVEARDEVAERRLARARLPHERDVRARRDDDVDVAERRRRVGVVAERRRPRSAPRRARPGSSVDGVGALGDVDRQVEVLEDPRRRARASVWMSTPTDEQRLDREQQARLQRGEGDDGADRDRAAAVGDGLAGEPVDERRHDREAHLDRRHPPAAGHPRADLEVGQLGRLAPRSASASSGARPIVLPSRMPLTLSDSSTSERHVGQAALALGGDPLALAAPTRRVSQTKNGSSARLNAARRQSSSEHRDDRRRSPSSRSRRSRSPCA